MYKRQAYHWLTTNRWFGSHLRDYKEERGATVGAKVMSIGSLWLGTVSYTHLRAPETVLDIVCRLLLEKKQRRMTSQVLHRSLYNVISTHVYRARETAQRS